MAQVGEPQKKINIEPIEETPSVPEPKQVPEKEKELTPV